MLPCRCCVLSYQDGWRFLPKEYPPWKTVYSFYRRAKNKGIWEKVMRDLVGKSRISLGRNPSYALIDSQSVKTTDKASDRGIDEKKLKAEKDILLDTQGHHRYARSSIAYKSTCRKYS